MLLLFWLGVLGTLYSYFLYPPILMMLGARASQPGGSQATRSALTHATDALPSVSMVITAHNEESKIAQKIENSLALDKTGVDFELIVASDFSTDGTDAIVESYASQGVRLVRADQHLGKEYAQLCAIKASLGEIIVFSDVATELPADSLQKLLPYFADGEVGAISSEDRFISSSGEVAGEGAYVKYEMWLRSLESRVAGLVGLSGSFFAARRSICDQWDIQSPSDFNTALNSARSGLKAISCPDVLGYYPNIKDETKEYKRKLRTAIRGMTALARHPEVLNPGKFGLFSFQVFSHKLMRWAVPWFMLMTFVANLFLLNKPFYMLTFVLQIAFYGAALAAHNKPELRKGGLKILYFFCQVNLALADAAVQFIKGTRMTTWQPSKR
ncbi:MAG: glycosyl transferase [unclassified Hahellaceae]|nr:glycosyl transferase [Hahellaceae bacterium]|tara:strand:+ start:129043 stop:130197 length:1155 start_codon:yes stop_codon:yes gene_type:complete